jgi:hypothetical protein
MRGLVRDFASIALWQRQAEAAHREQVTVYEPASFAGKRVVVGLDGGRLRLRINKIGSEQTPTRKYATDQCEPKLFAIYTVDDQGNKERKGDVFYDGTLQSAEALFTLLKLRLTQLAIQHARLLVIIGLTFRTLFRPSEAIFEEPPVEGGAGATTDSFMPSNSLPLYGFPLNHNFLQAAKPISAAPR